MTPSINKDLVFDHFANKTTTLQKRLIEEWLHDEVNQEQFYQWLVEWEQKFPPYVPQIEAPLQQFMQHMEATPFTLNPAEWDEPVPSSSRWPGWRWMVASSVLLGMAVWPLREQVIYETYRTTTNPIQIIQLTDGSLVQLSANSSLRVPRWGFGYKSREVLLGGEANFSVTHTLDHLPFIVKTAKQLDVVVLGTEFTLSARQGNAQVVLKKGKVQLRYLENEVPKQVIMQPGDLVTLDRSNHAELKTGIQPDDDAAGKDRRFIFNKMTLEQVAHLLQESYRVKVEIRGKELSQRVLMGSVKAANLDELLQTLSELLDVNVMREGEKVQICDKEKNQL